MNNPGTFHLLQVCLQTGTQRHRTESLNYKRHFNLLCSENNAAHLLISKYIYKEEVGLFIM